MKRIRCRKMNKKGALEGLPLYMIILVVIAGIGTAVIGGWMMSAQTTELGSMNVEDHQNSEVSQLKLSDFETKSIYVSTYDQQGDTLEGVTVYLEGCGAGDIDDPVQQTDENGEASFRLQSSDLHVPSGDNFGTITITAEYTGDMTLTETAEIIVTE